MTLQNRVKGRVQITTDALRAYMNVIDDAFGADCDYSQLHKVYSLGKKKCATRRENVSVADESSDRKPGPKHVSTSFVVRQNWTARTTMRRYTRLSNGFSRKLENHAAATALNYFAYNFIKIHRRLRMRPAMAAAVTNRLWDVNDLVALWGSYERRAERAA